MIDTTPMPSRPQDEEVLSLLDRHKIQVLREAGHEQADVARRLGVSVATVRRVEREAGVEHVDDAAEHRARHIGRPSKAAPFAERVRAWIEAEPELPTLELLRRARQEGYEGRKSAFYGLVAGVRPARTAPLVRFEGLPGEFSQHDFGQVDVRYVNGHVERVKFFASRLKYSRYAQVTLVHDESAETLVRTITKHFVAFGGVPLLAVFDRPRTVVTKSGPGRAVETFNGTFAHAMLQLGVGVEMCAPRSGNQKGSVERIVGWVKNSFFKVRRFVDREDLDRQLAEWLDEVNVRTPSRAHGVFPETRRREELPRLRPVRVTPKDLALRFPVVVTPTGEVVHDTVRYSVDPNLHGQAGTLFLYEDRVRIDVGSVSTEHPRAARGSAPVRQAAHRAAKVAVVRGERAKLYEMRQQVLDLGDAAVAFLTAARHRDPRHHPALVQKLFALLQDHGDQAVREAFEAAHAARNYQVSELLRALRTSSAARRRRLEEPRRREAPPRGRASAPSTTSRRRAAPRGDGR